MKDSLTLATSIFLLASAMLFQHVAFADTTTPAASTRAFYAWYINVQSHEKYPLLDKGIYIHVMKATADKLRDDYRHDRLPGDSDYFTKVQDYDAKDWANHIAMLPTLMLGDVAVVPVAFGSTDRISVLVFLRKQGNDWKITKVDDTLDYQ